MTGLDEQRLARAALTYLAEPADPALGALLAIAVGRTRSLTGLARRTFAGRRRVSVRRGR